MFGVIVGVGELVEMKGFSKVALRLDALSRTKVA